MIKTNDKTSTNWSEWIKSGAIWARIRAPETRLVVYVTFFPRNMIKMYVSKFFPRSGIFNKSIIHVFFMTMCVNVAKDHIFIYRWNIYMFFNIFAHSRFFNHASHMPQDTCYKLNTFCNLVQLWYVIISMMSFIFQLYQKLNTLYNHGPGLRGLVGGP